MQDLLTPTAHNQQDYAALTALRGVLAVIVVFYHFQSDASPFLHLPGMIRKGDVAVSAFFILSGFVLGRANLSRKITIKSFLLSRLARVYPLYLLSIVMISPIVLYSAHLTGMRQGLWLELILTATCLQSWHAETWHRWNLVGWSICCEAFFYILFPIIMRGLQTVRPHIKFIIPGLAMISGLLFFPGILYFDAGSAWIHPHSPIIRLPEFCLGVATAMMPGHGMRGCGLWVRVAILGACLIGMLEFHVERMVLLWIPLAWAALVWLLAVPLPAGIPAWLTWLGRISYALYLFHLIAATYSRPVAIPVLGSKAFLMKILAGFVVAHFMYKWVEVPARRWILAVANNQNAREIAKVSM